jgi:hypothetical protein
MPLNLEDPAALNPLLESADRRAQAGAVARAAFERCFTQEAMVAQFMRMLESADQPGGSAAP